MDPDVPLGTLTMSHQPGTAFLSVKNSVLLRTVPDVNDEGEMCLAIHLYLRDYRCVDAETSRTISFV